MPHPQRRGRTVAMSADAHMPSGPKNPVPRMNPVAVQMFVSAGGPMTVLKVHPASVACKRLPDVAIIYYNTPVMGPAHSAICPVG